MIRDSGIVKQGFRTASRRYGRTAACVRVCVRAPARTAALRACAAHRAAGTAGIARTAGNAGTARLIPGRARGGLPSTTARLSPSQILASPPCACSLPSASRSSSAPRCASASGILALARERSISGRDAELPAPPRGCRGRGHADRGRTRSCANMQTARQPTPMSWWAR